MEPKKPPTIKTNRFTQVLIYAVLEWTLISLLLLNSLFSYLILKFAHYFRLKPPCLICSRLDHIWDPQNSYRNLICEHHSIEFSKSGYCFSHRKVVESQELCVDCSCTHPDLPSQVKQLKCSCCGSESLPTHVVIESCLGVLGDTQKGNLVSRDGFVGDLRNDEGNSDQDEGDLVLEGKGELQLEGSKSNGDAIRGAYENDIVLPQHLEFYIDHDDYGLIPVEFFNLDQEKGSQVWRETDDGLVFEPDGIVGEQNLSSYCLDVMKLDVPKIEDLSYKQEIDGIVRLGEIKIEALPTINGLEGMLEEGNSDETPIKHLLPKEGMLEEEEEMKEELDADVAADGSKVEKFPTAQGQAEETNREVYLEVADVGLTTNDDQSSEVRKVDELEAKIPIRDSDDVCDSDNESDEVSIKNGNLDVEESDHYGSKKAKTEEEGENEKENKLNEVVDDGAPDTPTSIDSLHKKLLLLGRGKMGNEESMDGSVVNDLEYGDGEGTIEELKSEIRAERKTLRALYEELEEERNAAAIAASHTMAMINRLQEEKAIIEMEALQYQRMMEEQAEYDQEALQLMNEILLKREREKEELERKLMEYEEREEINQTTSSAFSSNKEENDGLSVELNNESKENGHHDSSGDAILNLKDSLISFEEERVSILEQLKVLEENLCTLAEEEDHQIRNMKTFEEFYQDNAEELSTTFKLNGDANGDSEFSDEDEGRLDPFLLEEMPLTRFESEKRRFTIEEEVERLYERLQALEADREFIKHCFGTLKKGDRGIYLLQEILQHLRDLKNVEFRARSFDGVC